MNMDMDVDDSDDLTNGEHKLLIYNIPKEISLLKLKKLLGREIDAALWQLERMIPLEDSNMARLSCTSDDICEKFLATNIDELDSTASVLRMKVIRWNAAHELTFPQPLDASMSTMADLNFDCLRYTFKKCSLKDQIALAKVCKYFLEVINDIWRCEYKMLCYKLYDFKLKYRLSSIELQDFFMMSGKYVEKMVYDSFYYMQIIEKQKLHKFRGSVLSRGIKYLNVHLCQHLMYFPNLQSFEVQGLFFADFAIKELAYYCPGVRVFKMLDIGSHWLCGTYFHLFQHLEELSLEDCKNFQRRNLSTICQLRKVKKLNITDCNHLIDAKYITLLCQSLEHVTSLKLTAITDEKMVATILQLKNLQILQFSWLSDIYDFEMLLCTQITKHRKDSLCSLKIVNDRIHDLNANKSQQKLSPYYYASTRENNTIQGKPWVWQWTLPEFVGFFENLNTLEEITFEYCRILKHEYLLELPRVCKSLKCVNLIGCREVTDDKLKKMWTEETENCKLCIEGLIPATVVQQFRERAPSPQVSVLRTIKCRFN